MSVSIAFVFLLMLASIVAMFARRFHLPYTVALVVTGLGVSLLREQIFPSFDIGLHLTPDLLFVVFLPILIFEAAFHFELSDFGSNWRSIMTLAAPGLVLGIAVTGGLVFCVFWLLGPELGLLGSFLIAAILSATDPVAVIGLFRALGAPKRLGVIMEGESLFNDGVAVVIFSVMLVALGLDSVHPELTAGFVVRFFGWEILGALLIGGMV
ncbi:MAG: cation:proton antiporter, partial [Deltaproteobacteria bacterium]|nr:cation:proton antiporter [Deltaproteobacteria bacterium]